jgi:hypothetical protein
VRSDNFEKCDPICGLSVRPTPSTFRPEFHQRSHRAPALARTVLTEHLVPVTSLASKDVEEMFGIFTRYYVEVTRKLFERDLCEKDRVILLTDDRGRIQGFSSAKTIELPVNCGRGRAIFSGDTVVAQSHWGDPALARGFIRFASTIKAQRPDEPLYWFLIVKGHRTYRYLPLFFNRFHPAADGATAPAIQALMDRLASDRFGEHYNRTTGVVRFPAPSTRLSQRVADIPEKDKDRAEVQFFLDRNPGYRNGDELVCLAEIAESNLKPYARRYFLQCHHD